MSARALLLLAAVLLALCAVVQTLAIVGTPEVQRWLLVAGRAAWSSSAVGLLICGAAICFCLSCFSRGWRVARG